MEGLVGGRLPCRGEDDEDEEDDCYHKVQIKKGAKESEITGNSRSRSSLDPFESFCPGFNKCPQVAQFSQEPGETCSS